MKNEKDDNVIYVENWKERKLLKEEEDALCLEDIDIWVPADSHVIADFFENLINQKEKSQAKLTVYINEDRK